MPRLYRYVSGAGYYLRDYVPSVGYCTWQLNESGLRYLRERGAGSPGEHVSIRDRNHLRDRGWAWLKGDGGPRGPADDKALAPSLAALAADLERWAAQGGLEPLTKLLYGANGDQRDRCFSGTFLRWLTILDLPGGLPELAEVSAPDFDDLAQACLVRLEDPLHSYFAHQGTMHVLWRLARFVGLVSRQRQASAGSSECPLVWRQHQPVLERLFALLTPLATGAAGKTNRTQLLCRPCVRWEVDLQQVVAHLPGQLLPADARSVAWQVRPGECRPPQVQAEGARSRLQDSFSEPLAPATTYLLETVLKYADGQSSPPVQRRFSLPDSFSPCVLFATDGALIPEDSEPLPAGEYLALVPKAGVPALRSRRGVELVERVPIGPVGWHGWQGWRVTLAADADVTPYRVEAAADSAAWEVEMLPLPLVAWRETLPVWVGGWPRLFLADPAIFADACLFIEREGADGEAGPLYLRLGRDVPIRVDPQSGRSFIDLQSAPAARGCFGRIWLRCRPLSHPDGPVPDTRIVRLPELTIGYVPDPSAPSDSMAVRARFNGEAPTITAEGDTEVLVEGDRFVLRPTRPHLSPGVSVRLPELGAEIRVRVPTSRGRRFTASGAITPWAVLPLLDLDLAAVGLDDRIRLELHEPPATEGGRLLFRLSGIGEVLGSASLGPLPLHVFEVELHRWRDRFGPAARGTVQLRARSRWIDVARLREPVRSDVPERPLVVEGERGRLVAELEGALTTGDRAAVFGLCAECFRRAGVAGASPGDAELLPLAAGRATLAVATSAEELGRAIDQLTGLADRGDLPEARLLQSTLTLRRDALLAVHRPWSLDRIESLTGNLAGTPGKPLLVAEGYYHFARDLPGGAPACWRSCLELTEQFLAEVRLPELRCLRADAVMLRELARLHLAKSPIGAELPSTTALHEPWVRAARQAALSLRTAGARCAEASSPELPALAPAVLRLEDIALLRVTAAHARATASREADWAQVRDWNSGQFFAIRLLRARQSRWEGRIVEARAEYDRLLGEVLDRGPDDLLEVITRERPS